MANRDGDDRRGKGRWQGFDLGGGSGQSGRNPWRFLILYIVVGVLLLALLRSLASPGPSKAQLSDFYTQLARHEVKTVTITGSSVDWTTAQNGRFSATLPPNFDSSTLVKQLQDEHVPQFKGEQPSAIAALLFQWILPFAVLALIWVFLIRRMAGGGAASRSSTCRGRSSWRCSWASAPRGSASCSAGRRRRLRAWCSWTSSTPSGSHGPARSAGPWDHTTNASRR